MATQRRPFLCPISQSFLKIAGCALSLTGAVALVGAVASACVPTGTAPAYDAGPKGQAKIPAKQSPDVMTTVFEDNFERAVKASLGPVPQIVPPPMVMAHEAGVDAHLDPRPDGGNADASRTDAGSGKDAAGIVESFMPMPTVSAAAVDASGIGPDWKQTAPGIWHIENGRLCAKGAKNKGIWLNRVLPINARIEFDAIAETAEGDLKAELWGDGMSSATSASYTNATSYLTILGGWHNGIHVLARINEHGTDRKEIKVDKESDDPRQQAVSTSQPYRFKVERTDGHTVRWSVNGIDYLNYDDPEPLAGLGHDHLGFNNWDVKVCFDNVRVTPL